MKWRQRRDSLTNKRESISRLRMMSVLIFVKCSLDFSPPPIERACAFVFTRSLQRKFLSLMSYLPLFEIESSKTSPSSIRPSFSVSVRRSVHHTDIILRHFTSSRCISLSFYVIRDVFRAHFTSFFSLPRPTVHFIFNLK